MILFLRFPRVLEGLVWSGRFVWTNVSSIMFQIRLDGAGLWRTKTSVQLYFAYVLFVVYGFWFLIFMFGVCFSVFFVLPIVLIILYFKGNGYFNVSAKNPVLILGSRSLFSWPGPRKTKEKQ